MGGGGGAIISWGGAIMGKTPFLSTISTNFFLRSENHIYMAINISFSLLAFGIDHGGMLHSAITDCMASRHLPDDCDRLWITRRNAEF